MKIIRNIEQGSEEWFRLRLGKVTGSRFKDVCTKGTGGAISKTVESYAYELATQIVSQELTESFKSAAMQRGNDEEPAAAFRYQIETGNVVEEITGFDVNPNVFVSPDRIIGSDGGLEIKNPNSSTQIQYIRAGILPKAYQMQVQGCIWGGEREWWDFMSYDDRLPHGQIYLMRIWRDDKMIKTLVENINTTIDVRDKYVEELLALKDYDYRKLYNQTLIKPAV